MMPVHHAFCFVFRLNTSLPILTAGQRANTRTLLSFWAKGFSPKSKNLRILILLSRYSVRRSFDALRLLRMTRFVDNRTCPKIKYIALQPVQVQCDTLRYLICASFPPTVLAVSGSRVKATTPNLSWMRPAPRRLKLFCDGYIITACQNLSSHLK